MRFLTILGLALFCDIAARSAIISSNLFTLATVNLATNTGSAVLLGTTTLPGYTFAVQTVGTGGVGGSGGNILMGHTTNIANMVIVGTYWATNDTVGSYVLTNNGVVPCYFAFQAFNTNATATQIGSQAIISR